MKKKERCEIEHSYGTVFDVIVSMINKRREKEIQEKKVLEIRNFSWKFEFFAFDRKISQQTKIEKIYLPEIYPMFKINNFSVG